MDNPNEWNDMPGSYHNGACVFNYADGHSELHQWKLSKTCPPIICDRKAIQDTGSADIQWKFNHSSVPLFEQRQSNCNWSCVLLFRRIKIRQIAMAPIHNHLISKILGLACFQQKQTHHVYPVIEQQQQTIRSH
jgi:prepilin-type processing-associated H-X9-DG protein